MPPFWAPKGMLEHKKLWEVFPEAKARMFIEGNQAVFDAKQPTHTEEWMSDASGQDRLLAIVKTPKIDSAGMWNTWSAPPRISPSTSWPLMNVCAEKNFRGS